MITNPIHLEQTLPIKDGLWEDLVLNDDGTTAMRSLDCITQKSFVEMMRKANSHPGCKFVNQNISGHGMTVDTSCDRPNVQVSDYCHRPMRREGSEKGRWGTSKL